MKDRIEIPLSKVKILLLFTASLVFVCLGIFFAYQPDIFTTSLINRPEYVRILGFVAVLLFGLCAFFLLRKLFDTKLGLIIDQKGITDNSSGTSVGLIEWEDIEGIDFLQIASTKFLLLITSHPDKYISKAPNGLARRAMKANNKLYGSPLCISSNALKIPFDELQKLVVAEFEKRKVERSNH